MNVLLLLTLIDVYLLIRVVNLARQIYIPSGKSLQAAPGIVSHTAAGEGLNRLVRLVTSLTQKAGDLGTLTGALRDQLTPEGR